MRAKHFLTTVFLLLLSALPGFSATISVTAGAVPDLGLFDYTYQFSITGADAAVDNIFLGSDDLSPLNVILEVNGSPAPDWSWLGNDTPRNYLQFFDTAGALGDGDVLDVTFSSPLAPSATEFAVGLDSSTSAATNTVNGVLAPAAATPEPASVMLFLGGVAVLSVTRRLLP